MQNAVTVILLLFLSAFLPHSFAQDNAIFAFDSPFLYLDARNLENAIEQRAASPLADESPSRVELAPRQGGTTCPKGYNACSNLGAPQLCCQDNSNCEPDAVGHVACCPTGAVCTGTITGIVSGSPTGSASSAPQTSSPAQSSASVQATSLASSATSSSNSLVMASTTSAAAPAQTSYNGFATVGSNTGSSAKRNSFPSLVSVMLRILHAIF